jgi:predicted metal-dependent hydrolase
MNESDRAALAAGVALFNDQEFWHAHEAWERAWLTSEGEDKLFLQGLIQLSAAYHHVKRGTYSGGVRLFDAALRKLESFPLDHEGIGRGDAIAAAERHRKKIAAGDAIDAGEFPKLLYN